MPILPEKIDNQLVSIIIVTYNQALYLSEALESALYQSHPHIEVMVVDDGSTDHTSSILAEWKKKMPGLQIIKNDQNLGYCKAFNIGWGQAHGDFIIDLSGDDILMPDRVRIGLESLISGQAQVNFTDAYYIDSESKVIGTYYRRDSQGDLLTSVPQGDVYRDLLQRYFICAPTMMISKQVLNTLNGYDESLHYEDFDFWVRSSRLFKYAYSDQLLVKKRVLDDSMSKKQYIPGSRMLGSTARVCLKAYRLNRNPEEHRALAARLRYELRQSILCNNYYVAGILYALWQKIRVRTWDYHLWGGLISLKWDWSFLNRLIRKPL